MRFALSLLLLLLPGCVVLDRQTEVRVSVGTDMQGVIGKAPIANLAITQPLPWGLEVHYQHSSSLVERNDPGQVDQLGIGLCVTFPLRPC